MAHAVSAVEMRRMSPEDLAREVREKQAVVAKMRLGLQIGSEKDIARYRRERKELSRLQTVLTEKRAATPAPAPLKRRTSSATVSAPAAK